MEESNDFETTSSMSASPNRPDRRVTFQNSKAVDDEIEKVHVPRWESQNYLWRILALFSLAGLTTYFLSSRFSGMQMPNQENSFGRSQILSDQVQNIARVPTSVLVEVLNISIFYCWKMEILDRDDDASQAFFDPEEYVQHLSIPLLVLDKEGNYFEHVQAAQGEQQKKATLSVVTKSSSTSLLRYIAMRGELYPITTTFEYDDDDVFLIEELVEDRMMQAMYVDELLNRMKELETHFQEQDIYTSRQQGISTLRNDSQDAFAQDAIDDIRKYLGFSEIVLADHHLDSTYAKDREINVADLLIYSLARRIFDDKDSISKSPTKVIPSLHGVFDIRNYPNIEKTMTNVAQDRVVQEYFNQHYII